MSESDFGKGDKEDKGEDSGEGEFEESSVEEASVEEGSIEESSYSFVATTEGIEVGVEPDYLETQSEPSHHFFVWMYSVRIKNLGKGRVQLLNRHWLITDAEGNKREVRGAGVVGHQPFLDPGESFQYASGTPLPTSVGFMEGWYEMEDAEGFRFWIKVPPFSLTIPGEDARLH